MNLEHAPYIYGQIALAVLILCNSIFSAVQKRRLEKREEAREEERKAEVAAHRAEEAERQREIARNLVLSQEIVERHGGALNSKIEEIKTELKENTEVNVKALDAANGVNEKIAAFAEIVAAAPSKVEIVQPADHPIPVRSVDDPTDVIK